MVEVIMVPFIKRAPQGVTAIKLTPVMDKESKISAIHRPVRAEEARLFCAVSKHVHKIFVLTYASRRRKKTRLLSTNGSGVIEFPSLNLMAVPQGAPLRLTVVLYNDEKSHPI